MNMGIITQNENYIIINPQNNEIRLITAFGPAEIFFGICSLIGMIYGITAYYKSQRPKIIFTNIFNVNIIQEKLNSPESNSNPNTPNSGSPNSSDEKKSKKPDSHNCSENEIHSFQPDYSEVPYMTNSINIGKTIVSCKICNRYRYSFLHELNLYDKTDDKAVEEYTTEYFTREEE